MKVSICSADRIGRRWFMRIFPEKERTASIFFGATPDSRLTTTATYAGQSLFVAIAKCYHLDVCRQVLFSDRYG
jgi:hypothetical protein